MKALEQVMKALEVDPDRYPHAILQLQIRMYFAPFPFPLLGDWALPWRTDYAIRRVEFDHWLLQHSDAAFKVHPVRTISKTDNILTSTASINADI